jgi:hypothetical protein
MALASGLDSQFGYAEEGTPGTFETPTRFAEFTDESLKLEIERIDSEGIRAGRRVLHRWAPGVQRVTGDVNLEFGAEGSGLLFEHMFGGVQTTGASDPYTHTFTPGDLAGKSLTVQINRPDIGGTDRVFSYTYCKVVDWTLEASVNEYAKLRLGLYGANEDRGQSLASASYPTGFEPFVFSHGAVTVGGNAVPVKSFTLDGDNGLMIDRHFIKSATPAQPLESLESGLRSYSGSFVSDFEDLTEYELYTAGSEVALVLTFDRASDDRSLVITMNVRFDGDTPVVSGQELLEHTQQFVCVSGTSDAAAITAVLENGDSAP